VDVLTKVEFEAELKKYGLRQTHYFNGAVRLWRKSDGQLVPIPEFDEYPSYILERVLIEIGMYYLPLYDSNV
jgi:hypothetical protein